MTDAAPRHDASPRPARPARARSRRALRISLGALIVLGAFALITALVLRVHAVQVAIGERVIAALDDSIGGSITVGSFDEVSLDRIRVRDLAFFDPNGTPVLELDHAVMRLEPSALFEKRFSVSSARVEGARLSIAQRGERLGLDAAFRSTAPPGGGGGGVIVDLRAIAFRDLVVVMTLPGAPRVRANLERGTVAVRTDEQGQPWLSFRDARGTIAVHSPSISMGVASARGVFDGASRERFVIHVDGRLDDERFPLTLRLLERSRGRLAARLGVDSSEGGMLADFAILALKGMDMAAGGELRVDDRADDDDD